MFLPPQITAELFPGVFGKLLPVSSIVSAKAGLLPKDIAGELEQAKFLESFLVYFIFADSLLLFIVHMIINFVSILVFAVFTTCSCLCPSSVFHILAVFVSAAFTLCLDNCTIL